MINFFCSQSERPLKKGWTGFGNLLCPRSFALRFKGQHTVGVSIAIVFILQIFWKAVSSVEHIFYQKLSIRNAI